MTWLFLIDKRKRNWRQRGTFISHDGHISTVWTYVDTPYLYGHTGSLERARGNAEEGKNSVCEREMGWIGGTSSKLGRVGERPTIHTGSCVRMTPRHTFEWPFTQDRLATLHVLSTLRRRDDITNELTRF